MEREEIFKNVLGKIRLAIQEKDFETAKLRMNLPKIVPSSTNFIRTIYFSSSARLS